jgi:hypothetical protein
MSQSHLDALSDVVAEMVAHLLQEQLAPILSTLKEHARLLDCHTALLNHSTVMNRYNIGKLDDLRELQNNEKLVTPVFLFLATTHISPLMMQLHVTVLCPPRATKSPHLSQPATCTTPPTD